VPLYGRARQRERLPCFWFSTDCAVLPAFGDFTGLAEITPVEGDRVFVIAGSEVVEAQGAVDDR
jgi:metallophosphoesterase superfamily enzyme